MPHPAGSPRYAGVPPPYTHSPYTPHQPLLKVRFHTACPAYYLREPRYGCHSPLHRPHQCRWYRPLISGTWSWPTCKATWHAWTAALRTLRPPNGPLSRFSSATQPRS